MAVRSSLRMPSLIILLGSITIGLMPSTADACEKLPCWGSGLVPGKGAMVPANLPAFAWSPSDSPSPPSSSLVITSDGKTIPIKLERVGMGYQSYQLARVNGLKPGAELEAVAPETCDWGPKGTPAAIHIGPEAPLPKTLGTLEVIYNQIGGVSLGTDMGSCSVMTDAHKVEVRLVPSMEAKPWEEAFLFRTIVDGKHYVRTESISEGAPFGSSWVGRGMDRLYLDCQNSGGFPGVSAGTHTVVLEATIPGVDGVLQTEALTVEMKCPDATPKPTDPADASPAVFGWCCSSGSALLVLPLFFGFRRRRS